MNMTEDNKHHRGPAKHASHAIVGFDLNHLRKYGSGLTTIYQAVVSDR